MTASRRLSRQIRHLFWAVPLVVTGLAALHQAWLYAVLRAVSPEWQPWAQLAIYGATGVVVATLGLRRLVDAMEQRERAEDQLRQAYAELQRTHRRLLALHQLGQRAAAALDVQEVLTLAARVPVEALEARATAVVYFDPELGRPDLEVTWNLGDAATARLRRVVEAGLDSNICSRCQALSANLNDACPLLTPLRDLARPEDIGSVVCLPFSIGQQRVGVLATYLHHGESPDPDRIRMLDILATELAPALEGARLRSRLVTMLNDSREASRTPDDLQGLLARALSTLLDGWGADAGAVLLLAGGDPPAFEVKVHRNLGDLAGPRFELALRLARVAQQRGRPVVLPRMRAPHGMGSAAAVPLVAEGETLGVAVMAARATGQFALHQAEMLDAVGAHLALMVRNAQLYHRLREAAVRDERNRLSREMHDTLAQTLGYLGMQAQRVRRLMDEGRTQQARDELGGMATAIQEAYLDVREAIDDLRLTTAAAGGLVGVLQQVTEEFSSRSGIGAVARLQGPPAPLSPEVELHLLRMAQEALANARKHSGASRVEVQLSCPPGYLELSVADNGRGFDPNAASNGRHHGLVSMRERARAIGAQLTIATGPGQGTRILVRVPVPGGGAGSP